MPERLSGEAAHPRHRPAFQLPRRTPRDSYSRLQVLLHWTVVLLLIAQYSTSGAIVRTHSLHMIGQRQNPADLALHLLHNRLGLALLAVMVARLALRLLAGVPAAPPGSRPWTTRLMAAVHAAFYAVLIAEGATGAVASYLWWPASAAHVVLFKILLGLVVIHVAAVLWHQLVLKDGPLRRMGPAALLSRQQAGTGRVA